MQDSSDHIDYVVVVPVWGAAYVARFLDCALPSWMAPGNFPALAELSPKIIFITDEPSFPNLSNDPNIAKLSSFAKIDYLFISSEDLHNRKGIQDGESQGDSMGFLTEYENRVLTQYKDQVGKAGFFFFHSDLFFADGSFRSILNHVKAGKRAVMGTSLRANDGELNRQLTGKKQCAADGTSTITIAPRDLVRMTLPHLHQLERARVVGESVSTEDLSRIFWRLPDGGLYGPTMDFHPFYCRPKRFSLIADYFDNPKTGFIDYVFPWTLGLDSNEYAFILDSDDLFNIGLEHPLKFSDIISNTSLTWDHIVKRLLNGWTGPNQYEMFRQFRISFHCDDLPHTLGNIDNDINKLLLNAFAMAMIRISVGRISAGYPPSGTDFGPRR